MDALNTALLAEDEPLRLQLFECWGIRSWANIGNHAWSLNPATIADADQRWLKDADAVAELPRVDAVTVHFTLHWWPDPVLLLTALWERLNAPGYLLVFVAHHERIYGEWTQEAFCGHGDSFGPVAFEHDFGFLWITRKLHQPSPDEVICHAAAVSTGDVSVLLAGSGGVGKTTLLLRLVELGCAPISDDRVALRLAPSHQNAVLARPVTEETSLPQDLQFRGDEVPRVLSAHPAGRSPDGILQAQQHCPEAELKHRFTLKELGDFELHKWHDVGVIVLLEPGRASSRLQEVDAAVGARLLFQERPRCVGYNRPETRSAKARIEARLERCALFSRACRPSPDSVLGLLDRGGARHLGSSPAPGFEERSAT